MSKIKLDNVRLSFPALFEATFFKGKDDGKSKPKFHATFLIHKSDTKTKDILDKAMQEICTDKKLNFNKLKTSDMLCVKDGDKFMTDDGEVYQGYADHWVLKTSNSKRPTVINKDKSPLVEDDDVIFAGCYVNALVTFWGQDNDYGKRVNCNIVGVQFSKGDREHDQFGDTDGVADVENDFDDIDDI